MIQFKNASKKYQLGGETIHALNNVSLEIKKGSFTAIMGPSGSGKSTFLNMIGGLDRPDKGQIIIEDIDLHKLRDKKLANYRNEKVGFIFQSFNLQSIYSALENVMLPMYFSKNKKQRQKKAEDILKLVGLSKRIKNKPGQLSGGEQQRVAVARALVNNPEILLADEPTGNLDSKNGKAIMKLLTDLNKQKQITIVMVTHDPEMAKYADRIIRIKDGQIR